MSKKTQDATKAWLDGLKATGAISDEEWKVLENAYNKPEFTDYVGETALMRSDYSRMQDQLRAEFENKSKDILEYQRQLADWRGLTEKEVSQMKAEAAQLRAERQRLVEVAKSYGLSEDDLGTPVAPNTMNPNFVATPEPKDQFDTSKYVTTDKLEQLGEMYTLLPAEINDITAEHIELFGKPPKGMRQIVERAIREQRSVRDVYEDEFKVADKRAELAEAQKEAEIKRRVEEQISAYRTEHPEIRMPLPSQSRSFVLANRDKLTLPENQNVAADQQSSVAAAVAHWRSMDHADE